MARRLDVEGLEERSTVRLELLVDSGQRPQTKRYSVLPG